MIFISLLIASLIATGLRPLQPAPNTFDLQPAATYQQVQPTGGQNLQVTAPASTLQPVAIDCLQVQYQAPCDQPNGL